MEKNNLSKLIQKTISSLFGLLLLMTIVFGTAYFIGNAKEEEVYQVPKTLSDQVASYQPLVEKYLKIHDKEEYTGVVLALMMQESGGRGNDPMQASESYCGEVGCIEDPTLSVEKGVEYFSKVIDQANGDIKLALQSYNFGLGFINYVQENGGSYTEELAIQFSQSKYKELKHTGIYSCIREEASQYEACYGDIMYVKAVLDYYSDALNHTGEAVQVALTEN